MNLSYFLSAVEETEAQKCESFVQGPNVFGRVGKISKLGPILSHFTNGTPKVQRRSRATEQ